ncbi:hypothetical protein HZS_5630 [Henneguya salminicola]|nr:hypothetical protein HZS_5630 [Henneguya salminicola]
MWLKAYNADIKNPTQFLYLELANRTNNTLTGKTCEIQTKPLRDFLYVKIENKRKLLYSLKENYLKREIIEKNQNRIFCIILSAHTRGFYVRFKAQPLDFNIITHVLKKRENLGVSTINHCGFSNHYFGSSKTFNLNKR